MSNALRVINLLLIALVLIAVKRSAGLDGPESSFRVEDSSWIVLAFMSAVPLLTLLALRRNASRGLRTATGMLAALVLALLCVALPFWLMDFPRFGTALLGGALYGSLCAIDIWAVRSVARQEASGVQDESASWFVTRFWRGEFPLGVSYWIGGILLLQIQFMAGFAFGLLDNRISLRISAWASLSMFLLAFLMLFWQSVGVWRSATRRSQQGPSPWPALAKLSVLAGVLMLGVLITMQLLPTLKEHALIAIGRDPLPPLEARVTTDDSVLLLHGTFGSGSAERVRRLLAENASIRTVALSSNGGRLREATEIAALVRERELNTYVDTRCESACTFVFLAGAERAATPNARIGFHRPSFAGNHTLGIDGATESMLDTYRGAGIPGAFLDRVAATESSDMWYPTPKELEDAGVINRVSLGGETSAMGFLAVGSRKELETAFRKVPMIEAMERHFPGTVEAAVQAAWMERNQGGIDSAVSNAARKVIADRYPSIIAAANDTSLDVFVAIMMEQMKGARDVSAEACRLLLLGQLNVEQVLSPKLVLREQEWALEILKAEQLVNRAPVDPSEFQRVMTGATSTLPDEVMDVIAEPELYREQPGRQCDATIALYDRITSLPDDERHLMLRGMFQAETP